LAGSHFSAGGAGNLATTDTGPVMIEGCKVVVDVSSALRTSDFEALGATVN
jgi:hypothetical protein